MRYWHDETWTLKAREIAVKLGLTHIDLDRISVVMSNGSTSRRTIARIHTLGKVMQLGMKCNSFYTIELLSERFSKESEEEKAKTIIHELLHIPRSFGGGFRSHRQYVNKRTVEDAFKRLNTP